jgi:FtsZ-interacting cell division protein YlmF
MTGTPFVKMGGAFDDLFDEDDDSDSDSDEDKEEEKAGEEPPAEEAKPKKKKKEGVGLKFSEDTKEGEDKPPRQPGNVIPGSAVFVNRKSTTKSAAYG